MSSKLMYVELMLFASQLVTVEFCNVQSAKSMLYQYSLIHSFMYSALDSLLFFDASIPAII